jgi:uncharacterized cupredoxin-like copper-binding protein
MHSHRVPVLAIAVLVAATLGVTACGGSSNKSSSGSSSSGTASKMSVDLADYKIIPANPSIPKTGKVTFTLKNTGKFPHAIAIQGVPGNPKSSIVQAGQSTTFTVNFTKKGTFTWYCPVDGHRQLGMVGKITIGGGS